eukprot:2914423-Rhodomonas_salina.1
MKQVLVCPKRHTLPIACASCAGFQEGSTRIILRPTRPASAPAPYRPQTKQPKSAPVRANEVEAAASSLGAEEEDEAAAFGVVEGLDQPAPLRDLRRPVQPHARELRDLADLLQNVLQRHRAR